MTPRSLLFFSVAVLGATGPTASGQESGRGATARLLQLDKNRDGKLTREEFPRPQLFQRFDRDRNGVITLEEIQRESGNSNRRERAGTPTGREFAYGKHEAQRLDVYVPENGETGAPVMVYVHGGSWRKGDKAAVGLKRGYFNEAGWVFVSVNYRLLPEGKHPRNVEDVAAALAWVHNTIGEYGGNPDSIFLMGHSAF